MYYIISLCHTSKNDKFITLWRPENKGYCYSKESAGSYESPTDGYHDSEDNMKILSEEAERLFIQAPYGREVKHMIPNCEAVWEVIGVKMTRNGLKRLIKKQ